MHLLIVNDEVITADLMKQQIPWAQYGVDRVDTAYSAAGARRIMKENQVDLMLCDIEMPEENGISLLRWCRVQGDSVECIFLTCHASFEYAREALELGCQQYLVIPARDEDIGQAVKKAADRIRSRREELETLKYGRVLQAKLKQAGTEQTESGSTDNVVKQVMEFILNHFDDPELSVNSLAERFHLHPVYLNRIFRKEVNDTISHYIITVRMNNAAQLLTSSELSTGEVAERVGYRTYSNFHLTFRNVFGCTPGQYREQGP